MRTRPTTRSDRDRPGWHFHRKFAIAISAVGVVLLASGYWSGVWSASPTTTTTGASRVTTTTTTTTTTTVAGTSNTGTGPVTRSGTAAESGLGGNEVAGSYSVAFAKCMRAHGIPKFPNPKASAGQLGPRSGINPASAAFRAALNGSCKSLAPAGWVSSGPVTK